MFLRINPIDILEPDGFNEKKQKNKKFIHLR
jgi:hypothetical protein